MSHTTYCFDIDAERARLHRVQAAYDDFHRSTRAKAASRFKKVQFCEEWCRDAYLDLVEANTVFPAWQTDEGGSVEYLTGCILDRRCPYCRQNV